MGIGQGVTQEYLFFIPTPHTLHPSFAHSPTTAPKSLV